MNGAVVRSADFVAQVLLVVKHGRLQSCRAPVVIVPTEQAASSSWSWEESAVTAQIDH